VTLYAAGDLQGCADPFQRLLEQLRFDPGHDHLWLVGDLVNRGPGSLQLLRQVIALGDSVTTVLGNHDLHLLAVAAGARPPGHRDTLDEILAAPDRDELLTWLRNRPLIHVATQHRLVLVHAGIPPDWTIDHAQTMADQVQTLLRDDNWSTHIGELFGNLPDREQDADSEAARVRYTVNALTRMRCCDPDGRLDFSFAGPPQSRPPSLTPWFDMPNRKAADWHLVFGHWAALGVMRRDNLTALDSGCVWGGRLSAAALLPPGPVVAVSCGD
jgi:bis(5'-nucleosyl)-tetraphosphatase (symmetrical)